MGRKVWVWVQIVTLAIVADRFPSEAPTATDLPMRRSLLESAADRNPITLQHSTYSVFMTLLCVGQLLQSALFSI